MGPCTRAAKSIKFLTSKGIENKDITPSLDVSSFSLSFDNILSSFNNNAKEGNRNNLLYGCVKDLNKGNAPQMYYDTLYNLAVDSGLPPVEIESVFKAGKNDLKLNYLPLNSNVRIKQEYTPVFTNGKTLAGKDRKLNYQEASSFSNLKYVAEELKNSNRIVIDCDSKETVNLFSKYLDKTESYINKNQTSAHFIFITDRIIPNKNKG